MDIGTEVLFQCTVKNLRLTIGLRMVSGTHPKLGTGQTEYLPPETADKDWVPVGHKAAWKTMMLAYHIEEESGNLRSYVLSRQGSEMGAFGISVYDHEDHGVPLRHG